MEFEKNNRRHSGHKETLSVDVGQYTRYMRHERVNAVVRQKRTQICHIHRELITY